MTRPHQTTPDLTWPHHTRPHHTRPDQTRSDQIRSDQIRSDHTTPDKTRLDKKRKEEARVKSKTKTRQRQDNDMRKQDKTMIWREKTRQGKARQDNDTTMTWHAKQGKAMKYSTSQRTVIQYTQCTLTVAAAATTTTTTTTCALDICWRPLSIDITGWYVVATAEEAILASKLDDWAYSHLAYYISMVWNNGWVTAPVYQRNQTLHMIYWHQSDVVLWCYFYHYSICHLI